MISKVSANPLLGRPEREAVALSAEYLRALGWRCEEPRRNGEEFTLAELGKLLGKGETTLLKRLRHPDCPAAARRLSPTGRLLSIVMTPELEAWLDRPLQPGRRLAGMGIKSREPTL